jgi:glucan biosynthesis protein C
MIFLLLDFRVNYGSQQPKQPKFYPKMNVSAKPNLPRRVYALDALRAVMMLLGLVLHTSVIYSPYPSTVRTIMAQETAPVFHHLVDLIHSFRMQTFFLVSGYFGALLYYRKGPSEMMMNRIYKILLPMIVFTLILHPLTHLVKVYAEQRIIGGSDAWDKAWTSTLRLEFLPFRLLHLWFLYYLMIFSTTFWAIAQILQRTGIEGGQIRNRLKRITASPFLRIILLFLLYLAGLWLNGEYDLHTNTSFWPDKYLIFCYLVFYGSGWVIYKTGDLAKLNWHPLVLTFTGILVYVSGNLLKTGIDPVYQFAFLQLTYALTTTLLSLGITGLFLKYLDHYSSVIDYVMRAAFFVYLIHVPIVLGLSGLLAGHGLSAYVQFALNLTLTIILSFTMYHFFVRGTFIAKFLDGTLLRPRKK